MAGFLFGGGGQNLRIINPRDYGAVGDNVNDDSTAIENSLAAMWGTGQGGKLEFPPGIYRVTRQINIANGGISSANTSGIITGAGSQATIIIGPVNNGFIFYQSSLGSTNGPNKVSDLTLWNESDWVGSGAMSIGNGGALIENVFFQGMINCLVPFNGFEITFRNCRGNAHSNATTGYKGTVAIAGNCPLIYGWRSTAPFHWCLSSFGTNGHIIDGAGIENSSVAVMPGFAVGWASNCTVSGNILTVNNNLFGSTEFPQFAVNTIALGRGLPLPSWELLPDDIANNGATYIVDDHSTDGTLTGQGFAGTYRINTSLGSPIVTPIPVLALSSYVASPIKISAIETEACRYGTYVYNAAGSIDSCLYTGTPTECVNEFGATGFTSHSGLYVKTASSLDVRGVQAKNNGYAGGIYFNPSASLYGVKLSACSADKLADVVCTATISNGSGSAGTIINVTAIASGSTIGIGMSVTGAAGGQAIIGNHASDPSNLTGTGGLGTYRASVSQLFASGTITIHTQADWVLPTATFSKTGLDIDFQTCFGNVPSGVTSGLTTMERPFTSLPGQTGADTHFQPVEGMEFDIVDGQKNGGGTAAMLDVVRGGSSGRYRVRYVAGSTNDWIRVG